ncbi:hypothetical protein F2P81_019597 [Scophthalmus maximus]|uniref:Uncharacterized protein n=1 Tax=Scophthalmus maximus TaxID=52904 RepID=A0A6A4SA34_SCOMX|nr:hypothetical protein F2P81_019597 [Scophthalmus maximus]
MINGAGGRAWRPLGRRGTSLDGSGDLRRPFVVFTVQPVHCGSRGYLCFTAHAKVMNDLCRKSHNVSTKPRVLSSRSDRNATEEGQLVRFYVDNKTVVDAKLAISANHNKWIAILVAASQQSRGFSPFPCLLFSIKSIGETVVFVLAVNTASYICERCR